MVFYSKAILVGATGSEVRIGFLAMFTYVETLGFLFRRNTDTDCELQDAEYDKRENEGSCTY